jgi:hypothetical protein
LALCGVDRYITDNKSYIVNPVRRQLTPTNTDLVGHCRITHIHGIVFYVDRPGKRASIAFDDNFFYCIVVGVLGRCLARHCDRHAAQEKSRAPNSRSGEKVHINPPMLSLKIVAPSLACWILSIQPGFSPPALLGKFPVTSITSVKCRELPPALVTSQSSMENAPI